MGSSPNKVLQLERIRHIYPTESDHGSWAVLSGVAALLFRVTIYSGGRDSAGHYIGGDHTNVDGVSEGRIMQSVGRFYFVWSRRYEAIATLNKKKNGNYQCAAHIDNDLGFHVDTSFAENMISITDMQGNIP